MRRLNILWWILTITGTIALVMSPWLTWVSNSDGSSTININGFNGLAGDTLSLYSTDSTQSDDGSPPPLPSLSNVPQPSGGSDDNAKPGVFVLVLGATALFSALWTLWGDTESRRSMTGLVFLLAAIALILLLHELFETLTEPSFLGPISVGSGVIIGLCGAAATLIGAGLQYWAIGRSL